MQLSFTDDRPINLDAPLEKRALIALTLVPGIGGRRVRALVARFGAPSKVWKATRAALMSVDGIGEQSAEAIRTFDGRAQVDQQMNRAERIGATLVTPWDDRFPPLLRQIYDPPAYLWMRGTLTPADRGLIHGTNERIPVADYAAIIAYYTQLIRTMEPAAPN